MPISATLQRSLDDAISANDFYEAHQIYLTIINRLIKQSNYDEAVVVISQGAKWLLESGQSKSALELASKILELLKEPWLDEEYTERIKTVFSSLPLSHSGVRGLITQLLKMSRNNSKVHLCIGDLSMAASSDVDYAFASLHYGEAGPCALSQHINCIERSFEENATMGATNLALATLRILCHKNGTSQAYELCSSVIKRIFFGSPNQHHEHQCHVAFIERIACTMRSDASSPMYELAVFEPNEQTNTEVDESVARMLNFSQLVIFVATRTDPRIGFERLRAHYFNGFVDELKVLYANVEKKYLPAISSSSAVGAGPNQPRAPNLANLISNVIGRMIHPTSSTSTPVATTRGQHEESDPDLD